MDRAEHGQAQQIRCATCGQLTPGYDIVNYGSIEDGYRQLCNQCLNAEVAKSDGLDEFGKMGLTHLHSAVQQAAAVDADHKERAGDTVLLPGRAEQ
jgi:NAD-dependent SIR2 family protein deacetylase